MINPLRGPKSYPYDLQPGDINVKETPEGIFYNLRTNKWVYFCPESEEAKVFLREDDFQEQVPFTFSVEKLRSERIINPGPYFIGEKGLWVNHYNQILPSSHSQKLSDFLLISISEELSKLTDEQNANYYDPVDVLNNMIRIH